VSGAEGRAPTFAMFCTIEDPCFLFAVVSDEVEAVRAYSEHVKHYTDEGDHSPYIHMEPMRDEWRRPDDALRPFYKFAATTADLDPARNLFRIPAERA
jgi:hypothetical protein